MTMPSDPEPGATRTPPPNQANGLPSKLRVLLVDDQEAVRVAIARLLGGRGHEVVATGTGASALMKLREEYFDVLLCDVLLPEMSGLEILSQAMTLDNDLPVLMLSGANDVATAREALKRGAMDFLTKPVELDDLDLAVRSAGADRRERLNSLSRTADAADDAKLSAREFELQGGPLDGQKVHLHSRDLRLWVAKQPAGDLIWGTSEPATGVPRNAELLGSYGLSPASDTIVWAKKVE